jgi:membrane-associated phospholipid phosphatase
MSFKESISKSGFVIYYLFLLAGVFLLFLYEKGDILLWINKNHSEFQDYFFKYWTHLGDGLAFVAVIILFISIKKYRAIKMIVFAVISQTIVIQGLKRIVFSDVVRPKLFFEQFHDLHQVAGIEIHGYGSFPSGHTATAFTIAVLLALIFRNKYLTGLLMIAAILVGFSRIYLLQHFFVDIYFGSIIGFLNSIIIYSRMESSTLNKKSGFKKGLIRK